MRSRIQFVDDKLKKSFDKLSKTNPQMHGLISRAFCDIQENAFCGVQIPKRIIPKDFIKKYKVKNLWKYNLPNAWRLIYSIESDQINVISIVLKWFDHKEYERKFGYN